MPDTAIECLRPFHAGSRQLDGGISVALGYRMPLAFSGDSTCTVGAGVTRDAWGGKRVAWAAHMRGLNASVSVQPSAGVRGGVLSTSRSTSISLPVGSDIAASSASSGIGAHH